MFAVSAAATAAIATAGWAQPQALLSWGLNTACTTPTPTVVTNNDFTAGPGIYSLYIALKNVVDNNSAYDVRLMIGPNCPDAWRFDDAGCQLAPQVAITQTGNGKTACPVLRGTAPLPLTGTFYDASGGPNGRLEIRLAVAYDVFTPTLGPNQYYMLWTLAFDHSVSVVGTSPDANHCGGAEVPQCLAISEDPGKESFLLNDQNQHENFTYINPHDQYITWAAASNCPGTVVPTQPATWGRVKGLYR